MWLGESHKARPRVSEIETACGFCYGLDSVKTMERMNGFHEASSRALAPSSPFKAKIKSFIRRTIAAQIHFGACIAAIVGSIVLLLRCAEISDRRHLLATAIFGVSAIILFGISSLYHFLYDGFRISRRFESRFEMLDHVAIYLFIAGSYSAILIKTVSESWANSLLGLVWFFTIAGIFYTLARERLPRWAQHRFLYTGLFLALGWVFIFRIGEILGALSGWPLFDFVLAGLSYTIGAVVYATKRPVLMKRVFGFHELWHLLVVIGFAGHYLVVYSFY